MADSLGRWTGGIDFLRFCLSALSSVSPEARYSVLIPKRRFSKVFTQAIKKRIKKVAGMRINPSKEPTRDELMDGLRSSGSQINFIDYRDTRSGLAGALRECGAKALFPCANSLGISFPFPWVGYIPDLQHKRLPQWFSEKDRRDRDHVFSRILADASVVVVNAKAVIQDIQEFYPDHKARLFSLPFCPPVNHSQVRDVAKSDNLEAYSLPERYFMVSNQFWIHKSHETAFLALRQVRDAGHDVHLVCTGNTFDYRWPDHFENLKNLIQKNDLQDSIHILGLLPKNHQLAIMRKSLAVVQPTLFEGGPGGGAVYDAVSIGKPCIVSDIPVNLEIDLGTVRYFKAGSAEDLASKMVDLLVDPPEMLSMDETHKQLSARQKELGRFLLEIAEIATKSHSSPQ